MTLRNSLQNRRWNYRPHKYRSKTLR